MIANALAAFTSPGAIPVTIGLGLLIPLLPLAAGLIPERWSGSGLRHARLIHWFALLAFGAALGTAGLVVALGPAFHDFAPGVPWLPFSLRIDALTAVMLPLVSFLGAVTTRYSRHYLAGDERQGYFVRWLSLTVASVLVLILSGNLLLFALAWLATSLSLHQLLVFYPDRPAAQLAARKKFLISRLGDLCLVGGLILSWQCFHTWEFDAIFAAAAPGQGSSSPQCLTGLAFLLAGAAVLKSAQFPFHSWLPDTMEAPAPVSALMHAGIINAGGFLVIRLSPILVNVPSALNALALGGAVTALFASLVMLTQTNVKRSLAYSTIAQMGFMMLQCGLGAFSLAALHLVAHSLYKAHAFLSSGSVIALKKAAWTPTERPAAHPAILILALAGSVALTFGMGEAFGVHFASDPAVLLLGSIFLMALAYLFWSLWASSHEWTLLLKGAAVGTVTAAAYFGLHAGFEHLLKGAIPAYSPQRTAVEHAVMIVTGLSFLGVLVLQAQLPAWTGNRWIRRLYVHAANEGYFGTLGNLLTARLFGKPVPSI
jgi:NAD(P)H-quinone oxidoreductase subunit 5